MKNKRTREIERPDGWILRETVEPKSKNSIESIGEGLGTLNDELGRMLLPISYRDGVVTISGSWVLFIGFWVIPDMDYAAPCLLAWFASLFFNFQWRVYERKENMDTSDSVEVRRICGKAPSKDNPPRQ